ncbi:uncharacterized protein LOC118192600 [Stegodyphus dumicola]|uniref:uncharacterized protein LOC118192600 n=1 Tax=Stegodyphus dumicola TaxID=202533 RepID=UPI0015A8E359|nr:uncharacterized protein LOC118192600 [Stegodyphus dumicola]
MTLDEKLEPFRGRCSFWQYKPKKPARHLLWIKIFTVVDFRTLNCTLNMGKICKNKIIPPEFLSNKNREQHSTLLGFQKDIMLLSYMAERNKCANLLSTMHNDDHIDESIRDLKKSEVITFYNMYVL